MIKLQYTTPDTLGVLETGQFKPYFDASEYVREIQKQVAFCKEDSTNFSKISFPLDSTYDQSESYRYALTDAMQRNKTDIIIYENLLKTIKLQLASSDTLDFNKFPPYDRKNFDPKEYWHTNYHAENVVGDAFETGAIQLYNKRTKLFEKNIIYKMKHTPFCDYEKAYTPDGRFIFKLN